MRSSATLALLLCLPGTAAAQLARHGDTIVASDVAGVKRLPAVAFDGVHGRWLVVWSLFPVGARILARDGTPLGSPFVVPTRNPGGSISPRVAYAPAIDAFLVTWLEEEGSTSRVSARLVRTAADGTPTLGPEIVVSETSRPKHPESSPSVAWSERSRTFLVTWSDVEGDLDVRARRLDENAAPVGDEFQLSSGGAFDAFPVVALSVPSDRFLVAWTYEPVGAPAGMRGSIAGRSVGAADGSLGAETVLYASDYENYPDIAYDPGRDRFLVVSWHIGPGHDVHGRLVAPDATPIGEVIPIAASADFEGGDGIGVAYSREADAYVSVFQSTTTEIWAMPVSGEGVPGTVIEATRGARMGTYAPRIAAEDGAPRWLLVASFDFDRIGAQVLEAPAVAQPDAGTMEDAGASAPDASAAPPDGATAPDAGGRAPVTGGCGCSHGARPAALPPLLALFALLASRSALRRRVASG
jgi:hypothetical protein